MLIDFNLNTSRKRSDFLNFLRYSEETKVLPVFIDRVQRGFSVHCTRTGNTLTVELFDDDISVVSYIFQDLGALNIELTKTIALTAIKKSLVEYLTKKSFVISTDIDDAALQEHLFALLKLRNFSAAFTLYDNGKVLPDDIFISKEANSFCVSLKNEFCLVDSVAFNLDQLSTKRALLLGLDYIKNLTALNLIV